MEKDASTGSTIALDSAPRAAPARALAGESSGISGPDPVEDVVAGLIREMIAACADGQDSRFEAPDLAAPSVFEPSLPGEGSRFESPGFLSGVASDGPGQPLISCFEAPPLAAPGDSDELPVRSGSVQAEETLGRLARELAELFPRAGLTSIEDIKARYPQLPDQALRRIARESILHRDESGAISRFEADDVILPGESDLLGPPTADDSFPVRRRGPWPLPCVGETIGDYRLLAALGRGVRGAVFLADQPSLANRPVVLKVTSRDGREHLSLAQLRHPHIVPLYCVEDIIPRNLRLLCMPYLGGAPLSRLVNELEGISITRRTGRHLLEALDRAQAESPLAVPDRGPGRQFLGRCSYPQAVSWIGACLADALQFAHQRDLVHLDLKPSNILMAADGTPMLLDFHLAQSPIRPAESRHRWLGGTPHYMSPEQRVSLAEIHDGRDITTAVDGRSDIYSFGLVMYQMLGGGVATGPYPVDRIKFRRPAGVPVGLADIIARCLAFDPDDRYPDAGQLAEDLRRHLADLPLRGVRNRSWSERFRKWCRRHPNTLVQAGRMAAVAAALLTMGALIALADAGRRFQRAESLLAEGRKQTDQHDYPAATLALSQGLSLVDGSWFLGLGTRPDRSRALRRELRSQLAQVRRDQLEEELHELADRLRFLYGTELSPSAALRSLERRLRGTWESRDRIVRQLGGAGRELSAQSRTDLLDLGILWADLRVSLAIGDDLVAARREALRTLDEAERLFGASAVLARERETHARALGLAELARSASRSRSQLAPRTAWEHYALGRALLAAGDLEAAAREFDRATDLRPQDLWAQFSRGLCAYRRHQYETALRAFEVCVALSPGTAECYYNRGLAHAALGHTDLARRDRDHALRLAPAMVVPPIKIPILYDNESP